MAGAFQSSAFQSDAFQEDTGTTATTTDAPTTADAVTRALVASRAVTAAPTTSDVATRAQVLFRSATEAISTADVATRAVVLARAATDAPTTADAVTRTAILGRTDSESIATSDAAVVAAISRAATDAPTTSDTATRTLAASRAASDAPTIAGTVTRSAVLSRTTVDSPTTSDTARSTFIRTATEAISTADVATRVRNVGRSTTEAVSATVAATRSAVLSRNLAQALTGADVALSVPVPYLPGPVIYIDGVNITKADGDPVMFSTARFMSAVNGVAGEAHFRVRDDLGTSTYVSGQPLSLVIDGQATWTGFITNVKRVYAFPALNVDDFGPTRFFDIDGTDLNILFSRRIVFNTAHPESVLAPLYSFYTPDVTAISDLLAGWLDLSGDALDTSTDVHHVGAINADQLARAWEGSDTWGQAMQSITALPASIYYIRPNRLFAYVDTDTPDAPFGLSDVPNGTTSKGYREMEVLFDGTNLANDVLAWGVGYGSTSPVFTRAEDATSQSEHGLWQVGQTAFGIYKQATIDRVADSILNGSPDHHRGAKDDRHAVTITTYEPGLLPAQKLLFESNVFGYSEVLPIRKMEITFPTPTTPRYELTLSQEIDVPWSFFDVFRLPGRGGFGGFGGGGGPPVIVIPGGCACGITDAFDRTVSGGLGTASSGITYTIGDGPLEAWDIAPGIATVHATTADIYAPALLIDGFRFYSSASVTGQITSTAGGDVPTDNIGLLAQTTTGRLAEVDFATNGEVFLSTNGGFDSTTLGFTARSRFNMRIGTDGGTNAQCKVWLATDPEPNSWLLTVPFSIPVPVFDYDLRMSAFTSNPTMVATFENLTAIGLDRCNRTVFSDDFQRTENPGWGTATPDGSLWPDGGAWVTGIPQSTSVNGGQGVLSPGVGVVSPSGAGVRLGIDVVGLDGGHPWPLESHISFHIDKNPGDLPPGPSGNCDNMFGEVAISATFGDISYVNGTGSVAFQHVKRGSVRTSQVRVFSKSLTGVLTQQNIILPFTLVSGSWEAKARFTPGSVIQYKIWLLGDTEPAGWLNSTVVLDSGWSPIWATTGAYNPILAFGDPAYFLVETVSQIEFDFVGNACYQDCGSGGGTLDDFSNRTIVVDWETAGGWGNASSGPAWSEISSGYFGVEGSAGILRVAPPPPATAPEPAPQVAMIDPPAAFTPGATIDMTLRVKCSRVAADIDVDEVPIIRLGLWNTAARLTLSITTDPTWGEDIFLQGSGGGSLAFFDAWIADTWFWVHWVQTPTTGAVTVWQDGDPEPGSPTITSTGVRFSPSNDNIIVQGEYDDTSVTTDFSFDSWTYGSCADVLPTVGGQLFGPFNENATRIDSTHYQVSRAIVTGTAYVWLDGFIARSGTDFTEDPNAGQIVFTAPVDPAVTVTVNYQANGMPA